MLYFQTFQFFNNDLNIFKKKYIIFFSKLIKFIIFMIMSSLLFIFINTTQINNLYIIYLLIYFNSLRRTAFLALFKITFYPTDNKRLLIFGAGARQYNAAIIHTQTRCTLLASVFTRAH